MVHASKSTFDPESETYPTRKKSFLFWAINKKEGIAFDPALNSYVSRCVAGEDFHTEMDNWNFSNRYSASLTGTSAYMCFD